MVKNHRRALAGYVSNTINIDSHVDVVGLVGLWSIIWFVQKVFDVNNNVDDADDDVAQTKDDFQTHGMTIISNISTHGLSCFLEMMIVLLVCKRSVGQEAIDRLWWLSAYYTAVFCVCIVAICFLDAGARSNYWPPFRHLQILYNIHNLLNIVVYLFAIYYCRETGITKERPDGHRFLLYMIWMNTVFVIAGVLLDSRSVEAVNIGICGWDLVNIYRFATFAPWVYFVLKRDCQYWGLDVDGEDEDEVSLLQSTNDAAWQEGASYQDIVIPKTAIYFRKKLEEHFDTAVELHFWRRRLVIVKRFQFDFLSRENIKCFKQEANIFRKLTHPNIVQFFGVVIDPPSLGIVMQFAVNGDLFKFLESKRTPRRSERNKTSSGETGSFVSSAVDVGEIGLYDDSSFSGRVASRGSFGGGVLGVLRRAADVIGMRPRSGGTTVSNSTPRESNLGSPSPLSSGDTSSSRLGFRASLVNLAAGNSPTAQPFHTIRCALQVAKGMAYLHSNDILHRDMKSLNVLLDENFTARIADFGESVFVAPMPVEGGSGTVARRPVRKALNRWQSQISNVEGATSSLAHLTASAYDSSRPMNAPRGETVGTPGWGAPEALMGIGCSRVSDVFGFGIILWEMLTWRAPSVLITRDILEDAKLCKALGLSKGIRGVAAPAPAGVGATQSTTGGTEPVPVPEAGVQTTRVSAAMASSPYAFSLTQSEIAGSVNPLNQGVLDEPQAPSLASSWRTPPQPQYLGEDLDRVEMTSADSNGSAEAKRVRAVAESAAAQQVPPSRDTSGGAGARHAGSQRPDDLILVEVSNMARAVELMCDRKLRPPVPVGLPKDITSLLTRCWHYNPAHRPDFTEVCSFTVYPYPYWCAHSAI